MLDIAFSFLVATVSPGWTAALSPDAITGITVAGTVVVGGGGAAEAFDERTGRKRWKKGESHAFLSLGADVVLGQPGGRIERVDARSGTIRWVARVCPVDKYATALAQSAGGIVVGCTGGRVARVDPYVGRVTARSDAMHLDMIDRISWAGGCHLNLLAHQSGAILSEQDEIVSCRSLQPVMPQRQEVLFLGTVGDRAVLADQCCGLSGAMEQPVRVFTIDGATGAESPELQFVPGEPFLAGAQVCVGQHDAIRCRPVGSSTMGEVRVTNLSDFPVITDAGEIGISRLKGAGVFAELDDVTTGNFHRVWSGFIAGLPFGNSDPVGSVPVRAASGAEVVSRDGMRTEVPMGALLVTSDQHFVFMRLSRTLAENRYVEELLAIPWLH